MPIGESVRILRTSRGWTQKQLAEKSGVSQGQLSKVESGEALNPSHNTLVRLAEALNVPLAELIGRPSTPTPVADVGRVPVPIVQVPAHAGQDWTWQATGQTLSIEERVARGRDLAALEIVGDCMSPAVDEGDIIIFDRWSRHPRDGDMVVVSHEGEIHVRWARQTRLGLQLLDNAGAPLNAPNAVLEGIVVERRQLRPRRRSWHDIDPDPR